MATNNWSGSKDQLAEKQSKIFNQQPIHSNGEGINSVSNKNTDATFVSREGKIRKEMTFLLIFLSIFIAAALYVYWS